MTGLVSDGICVCRLTASSTSRKWNEGVVGFFGELTENAGLVNGRLWPLFVEDDQAPIEAMTILLRNGRSSWWSSNSSLIV